LENISLEVTTIWDLTILSTHNVFVGKLHFCIQLFKPIFPHFKLTEMQKNDNSPYLSTLCSELLEKIQYFQAQRSVQ